MNFSNFSISSVRARCARMYSTAGISREVRKRIRPVAGRLSLQIAHLPVARDVVERRRRFGAQQEADLRTVLANSVGVIVHAGLFQILDRLIVDLLLLARDAVEILLQDPDLQLESGLRGSQWNGSAPTVRSVPSGP